MMMVMIVLMHDMTAQPGFQRASTGVPAGRCVSISTQRLSGRQ